MRKLENHLALYGIRPIDGEDYWVWAGKQLGEDTAMKVDSLRERVTSPGSKKRPCDIQGFYDFVALSNIAPVIHSMKADAICVSGLAVQEKITGRKKILDLGCGMGHLTTWYACIDSTRSVMGVDFSQGSILEARQKASEIGVNNVDFQVADITQALSQELPSKGNSEPYDAVIDTQTIQMTRDIGRVFESVRSVMSDEGIFISIPVLETARHAKAFLNSMMEVGFKLLSFDFVYYADCGVSGAYPVMAAGLKGNSVKVDLDQKYEEVWCTLSSQ